ncbi:MAG TPA: 50S ribosomal protein L11 methyltransferase [Gammaproteobacteria bacterium]|nr:50S ribosomal protein L11 methyltransferase [Gammaproteobacteria bacterium]
MAWKELRFPLNALNAESVEAELEELGALAVTFEDAADEALLEPAPGEQPLWTRTLVRALFDAAIDVEAVAPALWKRIDVPAPAFEVVAIVDRQWETAWRRGFGPMRFGRRLWICPHGAAPPVDDAIIVRLEPGLAFGTGTHPTTALCLEWLDAMPLAGKTVVDYGSGSGVLAIAAAKLGAARVYAVDHDPQALIATRDNAAANDVSACIRISPPEALGDGIRADFLVANILARPLIETSGRFAALVPAGGRLALSGILHSQCPELVAAYAFGFIMDDPVLRDDWALLAGLRK